MTPVKKDMKSDTQQEIPWWGEFNLPKERAARWKVGPLTVWIIRFQQEWGIAYERQDESFGAATEVNLSVSLDDIADGAILDRYFFRSKTGAFTISPAPADRPVVTRPVEPFHLFPGEETTIFVSSPLWIRFETKQPRQLLQEIPIYRPSDTWFGPSTREGELCYASRTNCRLSLDNLPVRSHRAITPVRINNKRKTPLLLERLSLPVNYLSVFAAPRNLFWTENIAMDRKEEEAVTVQIGKGPPSQAGGGTLVCGPRNQAEKRMLTRALSALLG